MARYRTPEEVEKQHLEAFGPTLGRLYHALDTELSWLHSKWLEYRKLYAHSKERVNLLNQTAPFFFRVVQDVLWRDVLLHIARMTDPPRQGRFENLTLRRLPEMVADTKLAQELPALIEIALARSKFARGWRNRSLAHQDLSLAIDSKTEPLPRASRQHVEEALESFRKVLNTLHACYLPGEVAYEHVLTHDDASDLVHNLAVAVWFEQRQIEMLRQGKPLPEDFEGPPDF